MPVATPHRSGAAGRRPCFAPDSRAATAALKGVAPRPCAVTVVLRREVRRDRSKPARGRVPQPLQSRSSRQADRRAQEKRRQHAARPTSAARRASWSRRTTGGKWRRRRGPARRRRRASARASIVTRQVPSARRNGVADVQSAAGASASGISPLAVSGCASGHAASAAVAPPNASSADSARTTARGGGDECPGASRSPDRRRRRAARPEAANVGTAPVARPRLPGGGVSDSRGTRRSEREKSDRRDRQ